MKTNVLKIVLFLIGVQLSSTQLSAQLYTTNIQYVRELVAVAQRVPGLEAEIQSLDAEVHRMRKIIAADSVIKRTRDQSIQVITQEKGDYKGLYEAQLKLTSLEKKDKRKWRRRTVGAMLVVGVLGWMTLAQ